MNHILIDEFNDFFEKIKLNQTQADRIDSAVNSLTDFLSEQYDLDEDEIFIQGSFSTNTVTKPAPSMKEGEYDVDLVLLSARDEQTPEEAIEDLESVVKSNGTYKDKIEENDPKIPCIRLRYADEDNAKFHVDLVPARVADGSLIEIPRRGEGWEESNPQNYTDWVLGLGERYQRTIMFLRRWRDKNDIRIKSIVLQVIAANHLSGTSTDSENLSETLLNLNNYIKDLKEVPEVFNPVLENELLTARWDIEAFEQFKAILAETADLINEIIITESHDEACKLWQKVLGEDFIYQTDKEFELDRVAAGLADYSHAEPLIFPFKQLDGAGIEIEATFYTFFEKKRFNPRRMEKVIIKRLKIQRKMKSGEPVSGGDIDFRVKLTDNMKGLRPDIYWQVVNTGDEAESSRDLRGKIFPNPEGIKSKYHHELTKYRGTHWIECFAVLNGVCVARSGRFYVPINHK